MSKPICFATGWSPAVAEMLRAFGLGDKMVRGFTLVARMDSVVTLDVEMLVDEGDLTEVVEVVRRYYLVAVESGTGENSGITA